MDYPIYCDLTTLTDDERARVHQLAATVFARATSAEMHPRGFALEFAESDLDLVRDLAEFCALDARCCQFAEHRLRLPVGNGPAMLEVEGADGAGPAFESDLKQLLKVELVSREAPAEV